MTITDTYNNLRAAIEAVEASLAQLKADLNMTTADAAPADGDASGEAPADQGDAFSTPALVANAPASVPTIEPVDEADVPDEVKAQDQGA